MPLPSFALGSKQFMANQQGREKCPTAGLPRAQVDEEFDPREYFMSLPPEAPKPPMPEADFDARDYFLNGGGGE